MQYFDNKFYDGIIAKAEILFPNCVTVDLKYNTITVKKNIAIVFHCSSNEDKVYIRTFIQNRIEFETYETTRLNPSFRLFGIDQVTTYLHCKKLEDELIKQIEG